MTINDIRARAARYLCDELVSACGTTLETLQQFCAGQAALTPKQLLLLAHRLRQTRG